MKEQDLDNNYSKNRFEVVKEIVKEFMSKRVADNIGVVLFGDSVLIASPLSFDKEAQKQNEQSQITFSFDEEEGDLI